MVEFPGMDQKMLEQLVNIPAERFRLLFLGYIAESEHQGWDGFFVQDVDSFEKFLKDFVVYAENADVPPPSSFFSLGGQIIEDK